MILCISEILISEILTCTNSLAYSPDGIQEFKMRFVRTEVLKIPRNPGCFIGKFFKISPRLRPNFQGLLT